MIIATTSRSTIDPPPSPTPPAARSLADLLTRVLADPTLAPRRARDCASSLRRFGGIVDATSPPSRPASTPCAR